MYVLIMDYIATKAVNNHIQSGTKIHPISQVVFSNNLTLLCTCILYSIILLLLVNGIIEKVECLPSKFWKVSLLHAHLTDNRVYILHGCDFCCIIRSQ